MSPHRAVLSGLFSLTEWLRFLVVLTVCCGLMVGITYNITRYMMVHNAPSLDERNAALEIGRQLRAASNELVSLTTEYLNQSQPALLTGPNGYEKWRSSWFVPRVSDYRRRLIALAEKRPELGPLLDATDTLAAQANRTPNGDLRRTVAIAVMDATTMVESSIGELGVGQYLNDPPRALGALDIN